MVTLKVGGKEYTVTDDQLDSLERQLEEGMTKAFKKAPSVREQLQERHLKIAEKKAAGTYVEPNRDPQEFADLYQPDSWGETLFIEGSANFTPDYEYQKAFHEFRQLMIRRNIRFHIRTRLPSGKVIDRTSDDFKEPKDDNEET